VLGSTACSATAACPIGQYLDQTTGGCATCAGATPVVDPTGTVCVASCPAGTLNANGLCTASAADVTISDVAAVGPNEGPSVIKCVPVPMELSPTAAFKSVSFEVQTGVAAYNATAGQCFGCAAHVMAPVLSSA
jgi:hypothetical protein